jgi:phospholipid N-methyltransferase
MARQNTFSKGTEKIFFFREFLRNWRAVGSVMPSSRFLASAMFKSIDFDHAKLLVEFGPGSGSITRRLLARMRPDARLIVFETSEDFCKTLKALGDPRLEVYRTSALSAANLVRAGSADCVFSGIPLANLSPRERALLVRTAKKLLAPHGVFIQFQYSLDSYKDMKAAFADVDLGFTFLNAPPAFVYRCRQTLGVPHKMSCV